MKKIIIKFILVLLPVSCLSAAEADSSVYKNNPNYQHEMEMQKAYKTRKADIVMLGNSLTHGANWNELLGRDKVVERGIPGDILEGYVSRLSTVVSLSPKICFVLGGANDVYGWIPVETIFKNYLTVINTLQSRGIKVVIQSTTYAAEHWGKDWLQQNNPELNVRDYNAGRNREIEKLNKLLKAHAKNNNIEYIDINSKLSSGSFLKNDVTVDGIHLNAKGYKIWAAEVNKVLLKNGL